MNNHFPPGAEKIVADYLEKVKVQLKGMNQGDQQEILAEIRSHIYESFNAESAGDDIDRILLALKRLGDPTEVVANRVSESISRLGRQKKSLLYILAGFLIIFFAAPLGMGGLSVLAGLLAALAALLIGLFCHGSDIGDQRFCLRSFRPDHHHLTRYVPGDQSLGRGDHFSFRPLSKPSADRRGHRSDRGHDAGCPGPADALVGQTHLARPALSAQPGARQDPQAVFPRPQKSLSRLRFFDRFIAADCIRTAAKL